MEHVVYINLAHREDRRKHIEDQLQRWGVPYTRMNAIHHVAGYIGCTQSHIQCLEYAISKGWDHVCIVEDDMYITDVPLFKQTLSTFLNSNVPWDVLLLGGNVGPPYLRVEGARRVMNAQTTTAYVVKKHYYEILLENFKRGLQLCLAYHHKDYRIDMYWKRLQRKDLWYILDPLIVIQKEGYSDIEQTQTNYQSMMLSYKE
jgi:GR25 family glycosyltransferase involved in LPS biosynthesis